MHNIILLVTDTFRYDNLGPDATYACQTPELDHFAAKRASSVEHFYTGSFPTIPHRTDLTTGHLGWPHYPWQPLDLSSANHAPALLRQAGYASQLLCDCPHLFNSRFQHGFDAAYQTRGQEGDRYFLRLNQPIETVMPLEKTRRGTAFRGHPLVDLHRWQNGQPVHEDDTFAAKTAALTGRWLEENHRGNPFFLWVDFFDPHEPWDAPEYLVRRYDHDYEGTPMLHPNYGPASEYTQSELLNLRAHYLAEAELVDRMIGRVLRKIDDLGLYEDSIVIVTSDHGFSIGEHQRTGKTNIHPSDSRYWPIYPEVGHVPFMVAGPEIPCGASLDLIAQPIDILPTMCELAGASVTPPIPFTGNSFAAALRGGDARHRDVAVSGSFVNSATDSPLSPTATTPFVVGPVYGYAPVGAQGTPELYNLKTDPLAQTNIIADHHDQAEVLRQALADHLRSHGASDALVTLWTNPTLPHR